MREITINVNNHCQSEKDSLGRDVSCPYLTACCGMKWHYYCRKYDISLKVVNGNPVSAYTCKVKDDNRWLNARANNLY